MTYRKTIVAVSVHVDGKNPIYGEGVTNVCVVDDAGGPFIELRQEGDEYAKPGVVSLDPQELEVITEVARELMAQFDAEGKRV